MGKKIEGKLIAEAFKNEIRELVTCNKSKAYRVPKLAIIMVGSDGGSSFYVRNAKKLAENLGLSCEVFHFQDDTSEESVIDTIEDLNIKEDVDGIMLQLPLPDDFNEKYVISKIDCEKDIDGLTYKNIGKFYSGEKCFIPCTPKGIMELIKSTGVDIKGKNAVVVGRSNIVGKPIAQLLLDQNATVTICHSKTEDLKKICSKADILVAAVGKPDFIDENFIKSGAIVIDVGTTMVDGKLRGDVVFNEAIEKAEFVTPVPGGVGAVTTTMLLKNTCEAFEKNVR
ncbi:bifunctional 5,10-methylenetetrahydrofolate dehydrogenase/5,10-methenyltetrahydrofolate cyclohydrolase [Clostridium akagii]|uniref:bifunctional 5,10-methylenetetrahydrofolate dehydrogenase/5,10-methenyltetrahydrofolate cyclohydrolase n=1 Tax=Clostridium akagii TaxID=91623 RepID=UPI00047B3C03|nr:tetrahydrofolate dehydrogenase/cyclohydrolase catalytic domain-containing protein [Clostridium akagii]